jgi:hypothetical protein
MRLSEPLADSRPRLRYPRGDPREPRTHAGTHAHFEGERRVPTESAGLGGYRLSEQIRECWRARQDSNLWPSAPEADLRELTTASSSWLMPIFIGCFGVPSRLIKTRLGSRVCMECVYGPAFSGSHVKVALSPLPTRPRRGHPPFPGVLLQPLGHLSASLESSIYGNRVTESWYPS